MHHAVPRTLSSPGKRHLLCVRHATSWKLALWRVHCKPPIEMRYLLQRALRSGGRFAGDVDGHESRPSFSGEKGPAFPHVDQAHGATLAMSAPVNLVPKATCKDAAIFSCLHVSPDLWKPVCWLTMCV